MPLVILLLLMAALAMAWPSKSLNLVEALTFSPWAAGLSFLCYIQAGAFLCYYVSPREGRLYRGPASLAPMVVMALICLNYSAGILILCASEFLENGGRIPAGPGGFSVIPSEFVSVLVGLAAFFIPTAPLLGLVLLIVHTWRMLPRGRGAAAGYMDPSGGAGEDEN